MSAKETLLKKIAYLMVAVTICMNLMGCAMTQSVSLTEEQNDLIAEYAAGLLLKYDKSHSMGLVPLREEKVDEQEALVNDADDIYAEEETMESGDVYINAAEDLTTDVLAEPTVIESSIPMINAFGVDGFEISQNGYELQYVYPPQESDDLIFSMQALPENMLLVVHLNLTNSSESANVFDATTSNVKARLVVNGGERIPAQTTILMNDLLTYKEEIAGYGMVDTVIVFEVPESIKDSIESVNLILVGSDGENTYTIK